MKTIILAGGLGTRISEESHLKPKPMISIGEKPLLWHILKIYSHFGYNDFVICKGYKGHIITDYFANYALRNSDVTLDFTKYAKDHRVRTELHNPSIEPWKITLVDTGYNTMTGGRILRCKQFIENSRFMLTYGDGVGNIDIKKLLEFHENHGKLATITSVIPSGRFGALEVTANNQVASFREKPLEGPNVINAGFFVLEPEVMDYIGSVDNPNSCVFEKEPLERLAEDGELFAYPHKGFWQPMDTLRDKRRLENEWAKPLCPWKIWS